MVLTVCFTLVTYFISAQNLPVSSYGLPYINSVAQYQKTLIGHPEKQMVAIDGIPGIVLDLRYATQNNFMHKKLYTVNANITFLRKPVYEALDSVRIYFAKLGFGLVVFDAYRPYSITTMLWENVKDDRYAANPSKGSGHNRGIAVDLSLEDLHTNKLVEMPTEFDNFSDSAHLDFKGGSPQSIVNRNLLLEVMKKFGFEPLSTEWWHFSWPHAENYEILDLSFEALQKSTESVK